MKFQADTTTSNDRSEFNIDPYRSLISAVIRLNKQNKEFFREILGKYAQHAVPGESSLREIYAP